MSKSLKRYRAVFRDDLMELEADMVVCDFNLEKAREKAIAHMNTIIPVEHCPRWYLHHIQEVGSDD